MKLPITIAALAGLTSAATAGTTTATVSLVSNVSTATAGGVFTVGVIMADNVPGASVFSFSIEVLGSSSHSFSTSDPVLVTSNAFGFIGGSTGTGVFGGAAPIDILGPTYDTPLDGEILFEFQVNVGNDPVLPGAAITFSSGEADIDNRGNAWGEEGGIVIVPMDYDEIIFESLTINIVPAPASASLLAGLGALALRRRR